MTVAFVVRICDLFPEFLANTLVFLSAFQAAGAIASGALQALTDRLYHFFVIIQSDSHLDQLLFLYYNFFWVDVKAIVRSQKFGCSLLKVFVLYWRKI